MRVFEVIEKLRKFPQDALVIIGDGTLMVMANMNPSTDMIKYFNLDDNWPCYSNAAVVSLDDDMEDPYRDDGWSNVVES